MFRYSRCLQICNLSLRDVRTGGLFLGTWTRSMVRFWLTQLIYGPGNPIGLRPFFGDLVLLAAILRRQFESLQIDRVEQLAEVEIKLTYRHTNPIPAPERGEVRELIKCEPHCLYLEYSALIQARELSLVVVLSIDLLRSLS